VTNGVVRFRKVSVLNLGHDPGRVKGARKIARPRGSFVLFVPADAALDFARKTGRVRDDNTLSIYAPSVCMYLLTLFVGGTTRGEKRY